MRNTLICAWKKNKSISCEESNSCAIFNFPNHPHKKGGVISAWVNGQGDGLNEIIPNQTITCCYDTKLASFLFYPSAFVRKWRGTRENKESHAFKKKWCAAAVRIDLAQDVSVLICELEKELPPNQIQRVFEALHPHPHVSLCVMSVSLSPCNVLFRSAGTLCSSFEKWPYLASDAKHFNWTLARRMGMGNQERTDEERSPNKVKGIRIYYCLPVVVFFLWWRKINTLMMGVVESVYAYTNPGKKKKKGIIFPGEKQTFVCNFLVVQLRSSSHHQVNGHTKK